MKMNWINQINLFRVRSYITHWLDAVDDHSIHSPFYYDFYHQVIRKARQSPKSNSLIQSSLEGNRNQIKRRYFYLLLTRQLYARRVLIIGTKTGISASFLAQNSDAVVTVIEDHPQHISRISYLSDQQRINLITLNNIETSVSHFLNSSRKLKLDLIIVQHSSLHRIRPILELLASKISQKSALVLTPIHNSENSEIMWEYYKKSIFAHGSVDMFYFGVLFFDPTLSPYHIKCLL